MLPVLIEDELVEADLVTTARGKLQALIGEPTPVSPRLFIQLLRKGRVILIVDRFSEMTPETRERVNPDTAGFPVAALVVTSRINETQLPYKTMLEPLLLTSTQVSDFVKGYLQQQGKGDFFEGDEEFFDSCRSLSRMVGDREITPLLAKLYIEQLVMAKEAVSTTRLPDNVPDLMLRYLDELHPEANLETRRRVQADAKEVAYLCVKDTYMPGMARRDKVLKELDGENFKERLDYLESKLRIVRPEGNDQVRFVLDPLVEYLAGLKVAEMYKGNSRHWDAFLRKAEEKDLESIRGFLLAVRDCCVASDLNVPESVIEELGKRGGLDPEATKRNRLRQRISRFTKDLDSYEPTDRIHACKCLGEIGSDAGEAVSALAEALRDATTMIREAAVEALGMIGTRDAVLALGEALKDEDVRTRSLAARALGAIGPKAEDAAPALVEALKDEDTETRCRAAKALGEIGAEDAVPAIAEALKDEVPY